MMEGPTRWCKACKKAVSLKKYTQKMIFGGRQIKCDDCMEDSQ